MALQKTPTKSQKARHRLLSIFVKRSQQIFGSVQKESTNRGLETQLNVGSNKKIKKMPTNKAGIFMDFRPKET